MKTSFALMATASLCMLIAAASARAQAPAASTPGAAAGGSQASKRDGCKQTAREQKLKGQERIDSMQLCVMEARVECLKEAISKKVTDKKARRDYIQNCIGG